MPKWTDNMFKNGQKIKKNLISKENKFFASKKNKLIVGFGLLGCSGLAMLTIRIESFFAPGDPQIHVVIFAICLWLFSLTPFVGAVCVFSKFINSQEIRERIQYTFRTFWMFFGGIMLFLLVYVQYGGKLG